MSGPLLIGIETGGTTVKCASATLEEPSKIRTRTAIPTRGPDETLAAVADFIDGCGADVAGLGLAAFGPLDLTTGSPTYGHVTSTPKPGWDGIDVLGRVRGVAPAGVPARITTDVTSAALAESEWGAGRGSHSLAYVTVGTGVGAGIIVGGHPLGGSGWPEIGHLPVARHPDDASSGICRFHGDCLEGLASGPAIAARKARTAGSSPAGIEVAGSDITAFYLAQLVAVLYFTLGIEVVVLGGGVLKTPGLLEKVKVASELRSGPIGANGSSRPLTVTGSSLEGDAGLIGSLLLACRAAGDTSSKATRTSASLYVG